MRSNLKSTTALFACLALAMPAPVYAQDAPILCADESEPPCPEGDPANALIEEAAAAAAAAELEAALAAEAAAEAEAAAAAEAEAAAAAEAEAAAAAEAEATAAAEAEAAAAAEADAAAEAEAAVAAEAEAASAAEAEAAAAAEAEAAADAAAAAEADAAAAAEADAAAAAEADAAATAEADAAATAEAEAAAAAEADAAAALEAKLAAEAAAAAAEEPAAEATEAEPSEATADEATDATAEATAEEATEATTEDAAPVSAAAEAAASGEAPQSAAIEAATAAAAAAATGDAAADTAEAEVVEEVVTEDTARSSAEDFDTNVAGVAREAAAPKKARLSDLEKALLIGAGAVVVGTIMSNNRKVELNSGDRVVVSRDDGSYEVLKDDNALMRQPGARVETQTFDDGSTLTTVHREDGTRIVTIRDPELRVLRRVHVDRDGYETMLIDDTQAYEPVVIRDLPRPVRQRDYSWSDEVALRDALERNDRFDRTFSLSQVRNIAQVRDLVPVIDLDAITFASGSAAIAPDQARALSTLGRLISAMIEDDPREVFLIEGHTDAVGSNAANLALSDRRAESVALALTEYFDVPPENLVVQGYGEEFLKIKTQGDERANRRAGVRRITDLLRTAAAN